MTSMQSNFKLSESPRLQGRRGPSQQITVKCPLFGICRTWYSYSTVICIGLCSIPCTPYKHYYGAKHSPYVRGTSGTGQEHTPLSLRLASSTRPPDRVFVRRTTSKIVGLAAFLTRYTNPAAFGFSCLPPAPNTNRNPLSVSTPDSQCRTLHLLDRLQTMRSPCRSRLVGHVLHTPVSPAMSHHRSSPLPPPP